MKKLFLILFYLVSIIASILFSYENPEKIEKIKDYFKKNKNIKVEKVDGDNLIFYANAFNVNVKKIIDLKEKTAFLTYPNNGLKFDIKKLKIFTQNGFLLENFSQKKLLLPNYFTLQRNGGVKTIIFVENNSIGLISGEKNGCYFAALILLETGKELLQTDCLPEYSKNNDFNGLGSSNIHLNNYIYFILGTPEKHVNKNSILAQDDNSLFGKILRIDKNELLSAINNNGKLNIYTFSKGHRVPQGLTKIHEFIFSVEHGPKGGDELNRIIENANYGWPIVSYGTNYLRDNGGDGRSLPSNHELNNFSEPILAFVPSIGISSVNECPNILKEYYKKNCLMALSLYGNDLRKGNSLIIFLLNEKLNKVDSFEIIKLDNLVLRHFVTNNYNELYSDPEGNIYISADKKGIYKISFNNFR
jgi:hypothetical protein